MAVEASIVVVFGEGVDEDSQSVSVEIDDTHPNNLDDEGEVKSSFLPTDNPVFLIHHDTDVRVTGVKCTDGTVTKLASNVSRTREVQNQLFALVTTKMQLSYFNINSISVTWWGNEANLDINNSKIIPSNGTFPCLADLSFSVKFNEQWKLSPPALSLKEDETYTIMVVVYMEKII